MTTGLDMLSEIVLYSKYAKYLPLQNRRETWTELVDRNKEMHLKKFPHMAEQIEVAYKFVYEKKILPSMRSLQFAGPAIDANPARIFNCAYLPADDIAMFGETMFLLLSGCGVGFSVQKRHIAKLPLCVGPTSRTRKFLVSDDIVGWADAVKILMKSYLQNKPLPMFDFSAIREKGALLVTSGGKAPGPQPLKDCLHNVKSVLDRNIGKALESIDVHDIICFIADAVLAGGIRRSATISLFDADDDAMLSCKAGNWWEANPQRGRANNSAIVDKHETTQSDFQALWDRVEASGSGEPGFVWRSDLEYGTNPCITGDTLVAVADGRNAVPIKDLVGTIYDVYAVENKKTVIKQSQKTWKTRENAEIWKLTLDDGSVLRATPDHQIMLRNGSYIELKDLVPGTSLMPFNSYVSNKRYRQISSNTGRDRRQYRLIAEHNGLIVNAKETAIHHVDFNSRNDRIENLKAMPHAEHRELHAVLMRGSLNAVFRIRDKDKWRRNLSTAHSGEGNSRWCGTSNVGLQLHAELLSTELGRGVLGHDWNIYAKQHGLPINFSKYRKEALGSIREMCRRAAKTVGVEYSTKRIQRIPIKPAKPKIKKPSVRLQNRKVKLRNMKEAQLQIFSDLQYELQNTPYKKQWIKACKENNVSSEICRSSSPFMSWKELKQEASTYNHKVMSVEFVGYEDVYDMTVEDVHNFGIITSSGDADNITSSGIFIHNCGEIALRPNSFCNLCEVNAASVESQQDMEDRVEAAAVIGTLQASYTDFHYLREIWKETTEADALIGVGLTGIATQSFLDLVDLKAAASIAVRTNKRIAKQISINQAQRITTVKPAGSTSAVLKTSSGIHAWHAKYFLRRMRVSKNEALYGHMLAKFPMFVEDDKMDPNNTAIIGLPCKAPESGIIRSSEAPIDLLKRVRRFNTEWVRFGHIGGNEYNNVSATISIPNDKWADIGEWMFDNRNAYCGLSVLPYDGGTYSQAPFEDLTEEEYNELAQHCDEVGSISEEDDNTAHAAELSCAGGSCEIL